VAPGTSPNSAIATPASTNAAGSCHRGTEHSRQLTAHIVDGQPVGEADYRTRDREQQRGTGERHHEMPGGEPDPADPGGQHRLGTQTRFLGPHPQHRLHGEHRAEQTEQTEDRDKERVRDPRPATELTDDLA
jgi:hypothetical protein